MEDDRVSLLEQQLAQAKLIAEEADKKYEEVGHVPAKQRAIRQKGPTSPCVSLVEGRLPIAIRRHVHPDPAIPVNPRFRSKQTETKGLC